MTVGRSLRIAAALVAALLTGVVITGAFYRPNTDIPEGLRGAHVMAKGILVRTFQQGSGPNVLLIHGSPGSIEDWEPVMKGLADSVRVTAFDRPGNGYSGDTGAYSPDENAEVALALMDRLKLEHVVVVGHSYGGATALAMALREPKNVDAYVILDSATYEPSRKADATLRMLDLPVVGRGVGMLMGRFLAPAKIRQGLVDQFRGHAPSEDFIALRTGIWSTPKVTHAIAAETLGAAANLQAMSPRYPSIRKPVFILAQAENDFRRATAERLHRDVPGSSLELLPDTGHYVQFEKTAEVVTTIRRAVNVE